MAPPCHPPPPLYLYANFLATRGKIFGSSVELNQSIHGGSLLKQPPCYQLVLFPDFDS